MIIAIFFIMLSQNSFSEEGMTFYQMIPKVVEGNTAFALDIYTEMTKKAKDNNLFFSPYSLSSALAMTYAGAKGNTATQISKVLHFPNNQDDFHPAFGILQQEMSEANKKSSVEIQIANALWVQKNSSLKAGFKTILEQHYSSLPQNVDFKTASENVRIKINKWVENKTKNKIKNLLKKGILNRMTRLVLVNAIYFKGQWARPFHVSETKKKPFFITKNRSVSVPMMSQKSHFNYMENDKLQVIELPYASRGKQHQLMPTHFSDSVSMVILLPKQRNGLAKLEQSLNPQALEDWLAYIRPMKIEVFIPKFKINAGIELSKVLSKMGMSDAFMNKADFSGINGKKDLFLTSVIHQAFVDVNEKGTEAAGATAAVVGVRSISPSPPIFTADHPFIFLIRHNSSGSILFMGRVVNPIKN
jgi:serpin B